MTPRTSAARPQQETGEMVEQARHLAERLQARLDAWDRDCDGGNKGYQCFCGEWDRQHKPDCDVLFYRELLALAAATAAQEACPNCGMTPAIAQNIRAWKDGHDESR